VFVCMKTSKIKLHADGNITCKTHWTIQSIRMLKYSIRVILLFSSLPAY
jgi:hypothetical protein